MPATPSAELSPQALLAEVNAGYDIPAPAECTLLVSGAHDTFRIETAPEPYFLKVYRASLRTRPDVLREVNALLSLGAKSVPVALPVVRRDGTYVWSVSVPEGERQAVLFTQAKGEPVSPLDERACSLLGQALARIHEAAAGFAQAPAAYDLEQLIDRPLSVLAPVLRRRPDDWSFLEDLAGRLRRRITLLPAANLDRGFCHGEFNVRNNHLRPDTGEVTTFDFEGCGDGFRAYDLAVFRFMLEGDSDPEPRWRAYLDGYAERRPLPAIDRQAIPLFVPLRPLGILMNIVRTHKPRPDGGLPSPDFFADVLRFLREWDRAYL